MTSFWSIWIIILTTISLILTTYILIDHGSGGQPTDQTTGHEFDGIEELDNPVPSWWYYMFIITIVWVLAI